MIFNIAMSNIMLINKVVVVIPMIMLSIYHRSNAEVSCIATRDDGGRTSLGHPHGNSNGSNCFFPFTYNGKVYIHCTDAVANAPDDYNAWCATTDNYLDDKKWGYCILKTYPDGVECQFPFWYGFVLTKCIKTVDRTAPWCRTDDNDSWGYCNLNGTACPEATTTTTTSTTTTPTPTTTTSDTTSTPTTSTTPTPTTITSDTTSTPTTSTTPTPTTITSDTTSTPTTLVPTTYSSTVSARTTEAPGVQPASTQANRGTNITTINIGLVARLSVCLVIIFIGVAAGVTLAIIYRKKQSNVNKNPSATDPIEPPVYYNIVNDIAHAQNLPPRGNTQIQARTPKQKAYTKIQDQYLTTLTAESPEPTVYSDIVNDTASQVHNPREDRQAQAQNLTAYEDVPMHNNVVTTSEYYNMMGVHINDGGMGTDGDNSVYETPATHTYVNEVGGDSGAGNVYQQLQKNT